MNVEVYFTVEPHLHASGYWFICPKGEAQLINDKTRGDLDTVISNFINDKALLEELIVHKAIKNTSIILELIDLICN